MALKKAKAFASNLSAVTGLYASRCLQTPTQPTGVGQVSLANQAACDADVTVLKLAETTYSILNGGYGTMEQLVNAGMIRSASQLHPAISVGSPAGGYTIIGNSGCNDIPVPG